MVQREHVRSRSSSAASDCEISFRLDGRNASAEIPLTLWTDVVVDGRRVFLRTRRPVALLNELCASALRQGLELPDIEVRSEAAGRGVG